MKTELFATDFSILLFRILFYKKKIFAVNGAERLFVRALLDLVLTKHKMPYKKSYLKGGRIGPLQVQHMTMQSLVFQRNVVHPKSFDFFKVRK